MFEFLVANGHPPESLQEYSWDKLVLYHEAAMKRVRLEVLDRQIDQLVLGATAAGSNYKKGAAEVNKMLTKMKEDRENLVATGRGKSLIDGLAAKLMKSGIPRKANGK